MFLSYIKILHLRSVRGKSINSRYEFTLETHQKPRHSHALFKWAWGEDRSRQVDSAQSSLAATCHGGHYAGGDGGQGIGGGLGDRGDG